MTYISGDQYLGEWKDSKRHGQGTYTFSNGDKYVGEWEDGAEHGEAVKTFADGSFAGATKGAQVLERAKGERVQSGW